MRLVWQPRENVFWGGQCLIQDDTIRRRSNNSYGFAFLSLSFLYSTFISFSFSLSLYVCTLDLYIYTYPERIYRWRTSRANVRWFCFALKIASDNPAKPVPARDCYQPRRNHHRCHVLFVFLKSTYVSDSQWMQLSVHMKFSIER